MRKLAWSCAAILILSAAAAVAQTAGPAPCARPEAYGRQKAAQCRAYFRSQGLHGDDLLNNAAVCVAQARLTCLQKAAADHVATPMRTQFMASCMGA